MLCKTHGFLLHVWKPNARYASLTWLGAVSLVSITLCRIILDTVEKECKHCDVVKRDNELMEKNLGNAQKSRTVHHPKVSLPV